MYKQRKDYDSKPTYEAKGTPQKEGKVSFGMSEKALRNLPHSSYSILADPYTSSLPSARPYPIINSFNKKIGGSYGGDRNIDGGNVQQYANSTLSKMLKYYDFMRLKIQSNYRYRPTRIARPAGADLSKPDGPYIGSGLVDQCRQAIAEAVSVLQSTTFTQMGIYDYIVETDMAMGTANRSEVTYYDSVDSEEAKTAYCYTDLTDVLYSSLTFYQLVLQQVLGVFNWHNSFRQKMGTMIRSSWNRETPALNALFGLFKKKSWLSLMDSLAMCLPGEYVDVDWAKQVGLLSLVPSRRSDSITDPVLELQTQCVFPSKFKLIASINNKNIVIFDLEKDFVQPITTAISEDGNISFLEAIEGMMDYLSAQNCMEWARQSWSRAADADTAYFNNVKYRLDKVIDCLTIFKTKFNDVREVLDTVSRTGLVTWVKGFRPSITADTDVDVLDNQLINDIFTMTMGGADSVVFNNDTKRWRTYSLWNMYTGIPEYDARSGGAFITLSAKKFDYSSDLDETYKYLPVMFSYDPTILGDKEVGTVVFATNRSGSTVYIKCEEVTMSTNTVFNRLVPLPSQSDLKIRVPVIYGYTGTYGIEDRSVLYKTLTQIFGSVGISNGVNAKDYALEPDIIAIYQVEIEDITNNSIAYARATSPFRGSQGFSDTLGFSNFGQA